MKDKLLVILGPTASGKSALAVFLAKKFNGEIISADSRQVYKGLNIATGKITKKEMQGVKHHLLDVCNPKKVFNVSDFKKLAEKSIVDILKRNKLPIICGGTGFYIDSIVRNQILPEVKSDKILRKQLNKLSVEKLFSILLKLDKRRAESIDKKNKVRLIRAIEIAKVLGKVPEIKSDLIDENILEIGIQIDKEKLKDNIKKRTEERFKKGITKEAKMIKDSGISYKRMRNLGLEYRYLADFLQNKIDKKRLFELIEQGDLQYAKRQMTWFKRDQNIKWFGINQKKEIIGEIKNFLLN